MAELVDALVSGTSAARRGGSSPLLGTKDIKLPLTPLGFRGFFLWFLMISWNISWNICPADKVQHNRVGDLDLNQPSAPPATDKAPLRPPHLPWIGLDTPAIHHAQMADLKQSRLRAY